MASDINKLYLEWLVHEIDISVNYHNHKETMAWLITAFYTSGVIALGYYIGKISMSGGMKLTLSIVIAIAAYLIWRFANMQFRMRWESKDITDGLRCAAARLCSDLAIPPSEYAIEDCGGGRRWPLFVKKEITWLKERRPCKTVWSDDRGRTEVASYGLIIVASVVALVLLWTQKPFYW